MNYYTDVLKKYAVFDGRAERKEYWLFAVTNFVISIILIILGHLIGFVATLLLVLFAIAVFVPSVAVGVRRLHDANFSGWPE